MLSPVDTVAETAVAVDAALYQVDMVTGVAAATTVLVVAAEADKGPRSPCTCTLLWVCVCHSRCSLFRGRRRKSQSSHRRRRSGGRLSSQPLPFQCRCTLHRCTLPSKLCQWVCKEEVRAAETEVEAAVTAVASMVQGCWVVVRLEREVVRAWAGLL